MLMQLILSSSPSAKGKCHQYLPSLPLCPLAEQEVGSDLPGFASVDLAKVFFWAGAEQWGPGGGPAVHMLFLAAVHCVQSVMQTEGSDTALT